MKKILKLLILCFTCFSFILAGCSAQEEPKEEKVELKTIGEKTKGENVYKVTLTNSTGRTIKRFAIKTGTMDSFGENMLDEDDKFADEEKRVLYYDATTAIEENEEAQKDAEMKTSPDYTIQLTFDDDSTIELHSFPFSDVEKASIEFNNEESIAYIEYTSIEQDAKVSTEEAEIRIKQEQIAAQQAAEAAAQQAAQEQAQQEAALQAQQAQQAQQIQQQPVQQAPVQNTAPSANEGCLGDSVETW